MYLSRNTAIESLEQCHKFIDDFSFGIIISMPLEATHLPFVLERNEAAQGILYCHFAKANPHWQTLDQQEVLIVFSGPHAYISPCWYVTQPAVPTWNYAAVHVQGITRLLDETENAGILEKAIAKVEPSLLQRKDILSDEFRNSLIHNIVSVKINITAIEGKVKLGQHRSKEDQQSVVGGLSHANNHNAQALLNYMQKIGIGTGK